MGHSMQAAHKYREKSANHPSLRPKRHTNSTFLHLLVGNFSDFTPPPPLLQEFFRKPTHLNRIQRRSLKLLCKYQAIPVEETVRFVDVQLVHGVSRVFRLVHQAEVLPDKLLAGPYVQARKVRVENSFP